MVTLPGMIETVHPFQIADFYLQVPLGCPQRGVAEQLSDERDVHVVFQ